MDQVPENIEHQSQPTEDSMVPEESTEKQPEQEVPVQTTEPEKVEEEKIDISQIPVENQSAEPEKKELTEAEKRDAQMAEELMFNSELMDQQHNAIQKEIEDNSPLISEILPIEMLEFEFSENLPFLNKIKVIIWLEY
jgi:hypothetical protein